MNENKANTPDFSKYSGHILENVPGAMIVFGIENGLLHVRYITDYCEKISGFTPEETYERARENPAADAHPDDQHLFLGQDWQDYGNSLSYTYRIICKNGAYKWVHLSLSRVTEDGEILYYGVFTDVDEEKKKEEALKERQRLAEQEQKAIQDMYQSILDETQAMITVIDAKTYEVVYANKAAVEASKVKEYVGCICYQGIHHADSPCPDCLLQKGAGEEAQRREITYAGCTYHMIKKIIQWNNRPALLEYSEDVTSQNKVQQAEIDLQAERKANAAKTDFLSRVSHDMRTPLNGILGLTALLKNNVTDAEVLRDLSELEMSGEYLLNLINDTLDMSRIESGRLELHPVVCDGRGLFNNALSLAKTGMKGRKLQLHVSADNLPFTLLYVDKGRIEQIIMNIVGNCIKFTPDGGCIDITMKNLSIENGVITDELIISDTGVGMSAEFLPHIFEAFSQENTTRTGITQGTGLGMAITRQLLRAMGGDIRIESESGKGTSFILIMKFRIATEEQIEEYRKSQLRSVPEVDLAGKRILLCEDHPLNMQIATRLLETRGMIVEHAENGKTGVVMFQNSAPHYYDAILMDVRMPVMDGIEAAKTIRALCRRDAKDVPIVAMTANAFADDMEQTKQAGMDAHLSKPIQPALLFETLGEFLKLDRSIQKQKILIVDDIEVNRVAMKSSLENDYDILEAENGEEAMSILENTRGIDAVITDIQMPKMDGVELIRQIRSRSKYRYVVIIANTQFGDPEQEEKLLALGASDFVYKPTTPKIVEIRVRNALRRI